jgi:UDP-N-acetyl-D-mannosaminuronic acid transferase (WecB/TagA/CpsF family)
MIKIDNKLKICNFYGIKFYDWKFNKILQKLNKGGYLVAPAASALSSINNNKSYYQSLKQSRCAIFDSGFFCILLRIFQIYNPTKLSGFLFLKKFLNCRKIKNKKILLINSNETQSIKNKKLMYIKKFRKVFLYTAPFYKFNNIYKDQKIINYINKIKPFYILINIGGGKQEPLASMITNKIKFKCRILCLGAAIDFLNKLQAPINEFIDKLYLGWLARLIYNPRIFFVRVIYSLTLVNFFFKKNYKQIKY